MQSSSADQAGPAAPNPLLALPFGPALEALGPEYWDVVEPATFPRATLHFRNNDLLRQLGLDPAAVADAYPDQAYVRFVARAPLLALRHAMGGVFSTASSGIVTASCRTWALRAAPPGGVVGAHGCLPRVRVRPQAPGPVSGVTTRPDRHAYNGAMPTPHPSPAVP
ncbi:MAG: protein adenylyltransferase SelO family protein [Cyanobium sp. ELA507]